MAATVETRIHALLDAIKADFPRRKKAAEALMKQYGITKSLELAVSPPETVVDLSTFDSKVSRKLTPMLKARFAFAGAWKMGQEIWLSASDITSAVKNKAIKPYHRSLREHWQGSAPMRFADDRLTLFGITEGVPEDLTYLVWESDDEEPTIWTCEGFDAHTFTTLEQYFTWCLERE